VEERIDALARFTRSVFTLLVDFMTVKGLFTHEERDFLVRDVDRLGAAMTAGADPVKP